jgi:hypothetical protein
MDVAKPALRYLYLSHGSGRLSCHLTPVALLVVSTSGGNVLVHGSPHKSAVDEATSCHDAWVSVVMERSEDASAMFSWNDRPCYTCGHVTQDVTTLQRKGSELEA